MNVTNIYGLLGDLCIKLSGTNDDNVLRRLKYKVYDGLLFTARHKGVAILPDFDPLAWQLLLNGNYETSRAKSYQKCLQQLQVDSGDVDQYDMQLVLRFLFALENSSNNKFVPEQQTHKIRSTHLISSIDRILSFTDFDEDDFIIKQPPICNNYKYSNESFMFKKNINLQTALALKTNSSLNTSCKLYNKQLEISNAESKKPIEYSVLFNDKVWNLVLNNSIGNFVTWESFGTYNLKYELPFLCECDANKSQVMLYLQAIKDLENIYTSSKCESSCSILLDYEHFIIDVKNLLVGIPSKTFQKFPNNKFSLKHGCYFKDISVEALSIYVECFLSCGTNYLLLDVFCSQQLNSYIMKAFRIFLIRFMYMYRISALSISNDSNLLTVHKYAMKLKKQLQIFTPIFEITLTNDVDGVILLNYLYKAVIYETDQEKALILHSALYKCCEMYFSRFLQKWIFSGVIFDPYDEFFIHQKSKYSSVRERSFWSTSCQINLLKVPEFLQDLKDDILLCGKSMKLLKLCMPNSSLWNVGLEKYQKLPCSFGPDQMVPIEKDAREYYTKALDLCKPHVSIADVLPRDCSSPEFLNLIAQKRQLTLKRLQLERRQKNKDIFSKKQFAMSLYKEHLDQIAKINRNIQKREEELDRNVTEAEKKQKSLKQAAVLEEKKQLVEIYKELIETAEEKESIAKRKIETLQATDNNGSVTETDKNVPNVGSFEELDVINANATVNDNFYATKTIQEQNDTDARKNKLKTLKLELGIDATGSEKTAVTAKNSNNINEFMKADNLTDLQRNRLKVLSSEFGINAVHHLRTSCSAPIIPNTVAPLSECKSALEINRSRNMRSTFTLGSEQSEASESCEPMSIGTTPVDQYDFLTPNSIAESIFSPASYEFLEKSDAFVLKKVEEVNESVAEVEPENNNESPDKHRRHGTSAAGALAVNATDVCNYNLKLFLQKSVSVSLYPQLDLINRELLKHFVTDQQFFVHLENLRKYFFLLDGEFSRYLCNGLFAKLYEIRHPTELMNCLTLQSLIYKAVDWSILSMNKTILISFRVNDMPDSFNLSDPDVLECLSLSYRVDWPLNILLPNETIGKYDKVFKYLIKLHHIGWILYKAFHEMKVLVKRSDSEQNVMRSKQYRSLQRFRHIMTHFMQTLQNYTATEIAQSWEQFLVNVKGVRTLDELYSTHIAYIKNIMFMCLLNQKSAKLKKVLHEIFIVILKFYHYLSSRSWIIDENGEYVHPNFNKLQHIFNNFQEYVQYLFKLGRKVAKVGYQSEIMQLLDLLDINGYYSSTK